MMNRVAREMALIKQHRSDFLMRIQWPSRAIETARVTDRRMETSNICKSRKEMGEEPATLLMAVATAVVIK